jgi:hypothetical protein
MLSEAIARVPKPVKGWCVSEKIPAFLRNERSEKGLSSPNQPSASLRSSLGTGLGTGLGKGISGI